MFVKTTSDGKRTILIVYVNDILTGDHREEIDCLKKLLAQEFEIKDLGQLRNFLGLEVAW